MGGMRVGGCEAEGQVEAIRADGSDMGEWERCGWESSAQHRVSQLLRPVTAVLYPRPTQGLTPAPQDGDSDTHSGSHSSSGRRQRYCT